jgi:hypothetical protein
VVAGGVDDPGAVAGLDRQVIQVGVVVNLDGGDGLGLVYPVVVPRPVPPGTALTSYPLSCATENFRCPAL